MRAFAEAYPGLGAMQQSGQTLGEGLSPIVQPVVAQIPWSHHRIILDKVKDANERLFYIQKTLEQGWSKAILTLQIESNLYGRQGKIISNFVQALPDTLSDLAQETFKSSYLFDFLTLGEAAKERDVERALIEHLKKFMLELGKGFAYVGNQYHLDVGNDDFFLDLLFYNTRLHCYVVFELKVGDFKPEYAGKLNFYLNTINAQIKTDADAPTIGILLCKMPNKTVVEYALQGINRPMGVADYELQKALPKMLEEALPTVDELQQELEREVEVYQSPAQQRLKGLKEKIASLGSAESLQTYQTPELLRQLYLTTVKPLYAMLIGTLAGLADEFMSFSYTFHGSGPSNDPSSDSMEEMDARWTNPEIVHYSPQRFFYTFWNFKHAGPETFNIRVGLDYYHDPVWYGFSIPELNKGMPLIKKPYHQQLSADEMHMICDAAFNYVLDELEHKVAWLEEQHNENT